MHSGNFARLSQALLILAIVLAFYSATLLSAEGQLLTRQLDEPLQPYPRLQRDGPWLRVCETQDGQDYCRFEQTSATTSGDKIVLMLLPPPPAAEVKTPAAMVGVPLEVAITPGLLLSFDGNQPIQIGYRSCNAAGCLASVLLEGPIRNLMAGSNKVEVAYVAGNGRSETASFSLSRSAAILKTM